MNIIVFGHSVDPLDKEIFEKCFELAEERGGNYKFIFNYYDEEYINISYYTNYCEEE